MDEQKKRNNRNKSNLSQSFMVGKIPPQATDIEKAVLGVLMIEPNCIHTVVNLIFEEVFYVEPHRTIYKAILKLYDSNKKVDILTITEQLLATDELEFVGGPYYVTTLTRDVVSSANIEYHCTILLDRYLKREAISIGGECVINAFESDTDAFELYDITDNKLITTQEKVLKGVVRDMGYNTSKVYKDYETVKATGALGIQTGISPFDRIFCGLVSPDLFVIAARPGAGKTSFALSATHSISVNRLIPGAWFSFEMNATQLTRRLASIDSGISHERIRQGTIGGEDEIKFYNSLEKLSKCPIFIEDKAGMNIRSIRTRANILVRKNEIKYIVIDYLQLMNGIDTHNKNRDTIIGEITRGLKNLALELNIPVMALSQLSRAVEARSDKMPQLSDLRESGNIEQDADEVLFLMRPEYYGFIEPVTINQKEYEVNGLCVGKCAKNRHGSCENFAMKFNAKCMHFSTHEKDIDKPFFNSISGFTPYLDKDF